MKFTIKILNLLALLASVSWFTKNPDWEPLVAVLGLLASYFGLEITEHRKRTNPDMELFRKLLTELPPEGRAIYFLEGHDISAPFESSVLDELDSFNRYWNDAAHEFHNKKLEKKRKELYQKMNDFRAELSVNIFASNRDGWLTMDFETIGSGLLC